MKLSLVIPLYNEEESLRPLFEAIMRGLNEYREPWEAIFVDDGSTDGSFGVLRRLHQDHLNRVRVIRFTRNYGKSAALSAGIEAAKGEAIVTLDADLQDDPSAIPAMLKKLDEGWDVVSGWKKIRRDPLSKRVASKIYNGITSLLTGLPLHDFNCGLKAYRAEAAKSLEIYGDRHRYLPVLAHWNHFRVTEVPVPHHPRRYGKSKFGIGRATGMFDLITLLFLRKYLRKPMHFFGILGLLLGLAGSCVLAYFGMSWIITRHMHLRPLVLLSLGAIIMGIQFISIGLLGEMIANASPKKSYTIKEQLE